MFVPLFINIHLKMCPDIFIIAYSLLSTFYHYNPNTVWVITIIAQLSNVLVH